MNKPGTPKTLNEALKIGICLARGPQVANILAAHVRDFLAQRFNVAMLKAKNPEVEKAIEELWKTIKETA